MLFQSRWLDIGLVLFWEFMDLDTVSVHKHAKKELGQYPAILTPCLVSKLYKPIYVYHVQECNVPHKKVCDLPSCDCEHLVK